MSIVVYAIKLFFILEMLFSFLNKHGYVFLSL